MTPTLINRKETFRTISLIAAVNYLVLIESHTENSVSHSELWWNMSRDRHPRKAQPTPTIANKKWLKIKMKIVSWERDKILER